MLNFRFHLTNIQVEHFRTQLRVNVNYWNSFTLQNINIDMLFFLWEISFKHYHLLLHFTICKLLQLKVYSQSKYYYLLINFYLNCIKIMIKSNKFIKYIKCILQSFSLATFIIFYMINCRNCWLYFMEKRYILV